MTRTPAASAQASRVGSGCRAFIVLSSLTLSSSQDTLTIIAPRPGAEDCRDQEGHEDECALDHDARLPRPDRRRCHPPRWPPSAASGGLCGADLLSLPPCRALREAQPNRDREDDAPFCSFFKKIA